MVDIIEIQNRIRTFERTLNSRMTENEISRGLLHMCDQIRIPETNVMWSSSNKFYRARKLNSSNLNRLREWKKNDFWGVPEEKVLDYGRLNRPHESVLYLSNNPLQTLKEIRFDSSKSIPVVISCFQVKKEFYSVLVGGAYRDSVSSEDRNSVAIQNLYIDFFRNEFSKPVGLGTEYLYKLSNAIAKDFYDLPFEFSKAWTYPAVDNVDNISDYNVAFRSNIASDFIDFKGAVVLKKVLKQGATIPICFDSNYQLILSDNNWIKDLFGFEYKKA